MCIFVVDLIIEVVQFNSLFQDFQYVDQMTHEK